jgi:hypothetical protein
MIELEEDCVKWVFILVVLNLQILPLELVYILGQHMTSTVCLNIIVTSLGGLVRLVHLLD